MIMSESNLTAFKLNFASPVHFGQGESIAETRVNLKADQLFSAFCHGYLKLFGEEELVNLLEGKEDIPFRISSAFPYKNESLFLPWPAGIPAPENEEKASESVSVKYLEMSLFGELISGDSLKACEDSLLQGGSILPADDFSDEKLWYKDDNPRVTLDRKSRQSSIYHVGKVTFAEDSGLYFLTKASREWREKIAYTFELLGDIGIGGERSSGYGQFKLEVEQVDAGFPEAEDCDWFTTLAPYFPREDELKPGRSFYRLTKKSGWIYSPHGGDQRKKPIRYFAVGSIFPELGQEGKLVDVTPGSFKAHRVYCYALPFKVGLEVNPWEIE